MATLMLEGDANLRYIEQMLAALEAESEGYRLIDDGGHIPISSSEEP
jgi:hypothetical protein